MFLHRQQTLYIVPNNFLENKLWFPNVDPKMSGQREVLAVLKLCKEEYEKYVHREANYFDLIRTTNNRNFSINSMMTMMITMMMMMTIQVKLTLLDPNEIIEFSTGSYAS
uniref:Uncharacterized protein n=1 Tax=Glossina pallidipes TaxID=7398 RepID=A0A1B0AAU7_GLOPL